jgi:integrase
VFVASIFLRSNGFYYISTYEDGKRVWISTGERLKKAALKKLHEFENSPEPKKPSTNFKRFVSDFLAHREGKFAPATIALCERTLRLFQALRGDIKLEKISSRDIDLYISHRLKTVSPVTVNIEIKTLKASFNTALRWKIIGENPMKEVSMLRIPERDPIFLTREDFDRLRSTIGDEWFRRIVVVAASTGMRRAEILNLRRDDIDLARRTIRIQSNDVYKTKAGKNRTIPMSDAVHQVIQKCVLENESEYVFSSGGRQILEDSLTQKFRRCVRKANFDNKVHFHSLRHTFATWLVQDGVSLYEVQKLLGHSASRVTEIYSHLAPQGLHATVNRISIKI